MWVRFYAMPPKVAFGIVVLTGLALIMTALALAPAAPR
jgi:hypothetical protein